MPRWEDIGTGTWPEIYAHNPQTQMGIAAHSITQTAHVHKHKQCLAFRQVRLYTRTCTSPWLSATTWPADRLCALTSPSQNKSDVYCLWLPENVVFSSVSVSIPVRTNTPLKKALRMTTDHVRVNRKHECLLASSTSKTPRFEALVKLWNSVDGRHKRSSSDAY